MRGVDEIEVIMYDRSKVGHDSTESAVREGNVPVPVLFCFSSVPFSGTST